MSRDERQIRTTGNQVLVGYRANYHGNRVIAIMKGAEKNSWKCLDIIHPDDCFRCEFFRKIYFCLFHSFFSFY